jgi:carbonic anhydrase/acetyltransferase-like protein (isoleucine patch superfamily)
MTIRKIDGAYIADTARVVGEVDLGEDANLWYGVAVRGDVGRVTIGARTNLQDNVVVHCDDDIPNVIGSDVTVGHGAIVHGASVGDGSLIAIGARLLTNTQIGKRCLVAAGSVVPPGLVVPDDSVVMGVPGRIIRRTNETERAYLRDVPPRYVALARMHAAGEGPLVRPWGEAE